MQLTVMERMVVQQLLPMEGGMLDLVLAKNIRSAVEFRESELVALNIEQDADQLRWEPAAAEAIVLEVDFTGPQTKLIVGTLERLDSEKQLTPNHLGLCEKFGIGKE